jgi:hypothetical protein
MAVDPALAGLILATTSAVGVPVGIIMSRRGQRETALQQAAATEALKDHGSLEQTQLAVSTYVGLVGTLQEEVSRLHEIAEGAQVDLNTERRDHLTDSAAYGLIEQRCRVQTATLTEALNVLATVVVNETALQLIRRTRGEISEHPHNPSNITVIGELEK